MKFCRNKVLKRVLKKYKIRHTRTGERVFYLTHGNVSLYKCDRVTISLHDKIKIELKYPPYIPDVHESP